MRRDGREAHSQTKRAGRIGGGRTRSANSFPFSTRKKLPRTAWNAFHDFTSPRTSTATLGSSGAAIPRSRSRALIASSSAPTSPSSPAGSSPPAALPAASVASSVGEATKAAGKALPRPPESARHAPKQPRATRGSTYSSVFTIRNAMATPTDAAVALTSAPTAMTTQTVMTNAHDAAQSYADLKEYVRTPYSFDSSRSATNAAVKKRKKSSTIHCQHSLME